jgi:hypothetical protein
MALQRWPVALALFLANLAFGLLFSVAAWRWLAAALDHSLATRTLLAHLDMNVFVDLFVHHQESAQAWLLGGALLALVSCLLAVWSNAVAVVAVGEEGPLADALSRGVALYPTFLGLWLMSSVAQAASAGAAVTMGWMLVRWTAESSLEMSWYWASGAGVAVGALLLFFFSVVHDHARIHCTATGSGAARAYGWALRLVAVREPRALPLAGILLATGLAAWAVYQAVGALIPTHSGPALAASLLWGELLLLFRMALRVWLFAAETELQRAREEGAA